MNFELSDMKRDSLWELDGAVIHLEMVGDEKVYFNDGFQYSDQVSLEYFLDNAYFLDESSNNKKEKISSLSEVNKKLTLKELDKKVGDLINGDEVIVIHTNGFYKGGNTTKVKYDLANFMDDTPPFIEVMFMNKDDDCVYFTADLSEPIYDLCGMFCVKGLDGDMHG